MVHDVCQQRSFRSYLLWTRDGLEGSGRGGPIRGSLKPLSYLFNDPNMTVLTPKKYMGTGGTHGAGFAVRT